MSEYLPKRVMKANAERICALADAFGHLAFNDHGQKVEEQLNLSIPCARLVKAGIVTQVADTSDGVSDTAVEHVEHLCANAVSYTIANSGAAWDWKAEAEKFGLDLDRAAEDTVLTALYWIERNDHGPAHLHEIENGLRAVGLNDAERIRPVLARLVADGRVVEGKSTFGAVWSRKEASAASAVEAIYEADGGVDALYELESEDEVADERLLDSRVQRRLATDLAYRNAEDAEQQSEREAQIEREEVERLAGRRLSQEPPEYFRG